MEKTANIKMQVDRIRVQNYSVRNIITRALLNEGLEVTIKPNIDIDGRMVSEELTIYEVEKVILDDKKPGRSY